MLPSAIGVCKRFARASISSELCAIRDPPSIYYLLSLSVFAYVDVSLPVAFRSTVTHEIKRCVLGRGTTIPSTRRFYQSLLLAKMMCSNKKAY